MDSSVPMGFLGCLYRISIRPCYSTRDIKNVNLIVVTCYHLFHKKGNKRATPMGGGGEEKLPLPLISEEIPLTLPPPKKSIPFPNLT